MWGKIRDKGIWIIQDEIKFQDSGRRKIVNGEGFTPSEALTVNIKVFVRDITKIQPSK